MTRPRFCFDGAALRGLCGLESAARTLAGLCGRSVFGQGAQGITHELRLQHCETALDEFLEQCLHLGEKLGCLLIQLPPSLRYEPSVALDFFSALRQRFAGAVVLEPRHASWLEAQALLVDLQIGRVTADPAVLDAGAGWQGVQYWRLHGSPRIYHSAYGPERLQTFALQLSHSVAAGIPTWCIFDNTASGHAVADALYLLDFYAKHFQP